MLVLLLETQCDCTPNLEAALPSIVGRGARSTQPAVGALLVERIQLASLSDHALPLFARDIPDYPRR
jgi:hypothetical protein